MSRTPSGSWRGGEDNLQRFLDVIVLPGIRTIRQDCADCKVAIPDLSGPRYTMLGHMVRACRDQGLAPDIIAIHCYDDLGDCLRNVEHELRSGGYPPGSIPVWMTETGLEARAGSAEDENAQWRWMFNVLRKQASTPWWTNTIFYQFLAGIDTQDSFALALHDRDGNVYRKLAFLD